MRTQLRAGPGTHGRYDADPSKVGVKACLAKVSGALLCAGLLLGCQEQGSGPVGPDGLGPQFDRVGTGGCPSPDNKGHCHGDKGSTPMPTLDFADGMATSGFEVNVKDRTNTLKVENNDFVQAIQMQFPDPDPGTCVGFKATESGVVPNDEEVGKLRDELNQLVTSGFFVMQIDKTSLGSPSRGNLLNVERDGTFDGLNGTTRIMLGSPFNQVAPVTVTSDANDVFKFTGPVVVWAHGVGGRGGEKSNRIIQCSGTGTAPNLVTVTLTR